MYSFRKLILVVFLSAIFLNSVSTQGDKKPPEVDETIFEKISAMKVQKWDEVLHVLSETDLTYLGFYYSKYSKNSQMVGLFLQSIAAKLEFLAGMFLVDCDEPELTELAPCKKLPDTNQDSFPRIELFIPPELKLNPYTKQYNQHSAIKYDKREISEVLLYNFITQNIPSRTTKLTKDNLDNFLSHTEFNKVILFTDKPKSPLLYRGLSTYFYDRLAFGEVDKDQAVLLKKFKVTTFPTLILYQTHEEGIPLEEPKIEYFKGTISAREIGRFLYEYATKEKYYLKAKRTNDPEKMKYKVIFKILNTTDVMAYLEKFKERRFVLYITKDDSPIPEDINKFNMNTHGFFSFIHLDCSGDEQFCKDKFKSTQFPDLILINKDLKDETNDIQNRLQKKLVQLSLDYSDLYKEIYAEFPPELKEANKQNFGILTTESTMNHRTPFAYLYKGDDDVSLGLILMAHEAKYRKYVDFILYENPPKEILSQVNSKLPQLIALLKSEESPDRYIYNNNYFLVRESLVIMKK